MSIDKKALEAALATFRPEVLQAYVTLAQVGQIPCAQIEILTDMKMAQLRAHLKDAIEAYEATKAQSAGQPDECSVCKGNRAISGSFNSNGDFEGEENCPVCTTGGQPISPQGKVDDHEEWFRKEYRTPHSGFGVKESVVKASQKAWQAQETRVTECQRQANELIDARNKTIRFLEVEIERLKSPKRESSAHDALAKKIADWVA